MQGGVKLIFDLLGDKVGGEKQVELRVRREWHFVGLEMGIKETNGMDITSK